MTCTTRSHTRRHVSCQLWATTWAITRHIFHAATKIAFEFRAGAAGPVTARSVIALFVVPPERLNKRELERGTITDSACGMSFALPFARAWKDATEASAVNRPGHQIPNNRFSKLVQPAGTIWRRAAFPRIRRRSHPLHHCAASLVLEDARNPGRRRRPRQ